MDEAATERALVSMSTWMTATMEEHLLFKRLILSMALNIPRERLPEDERALLDEILERLD